MVYLVFTNQNAGYHSFRGTRPSNEDRYSIKNLTIATSSGENELQSQKLYLGIFDGYGYSIMVVNF